MSLFAEFCSIPLMIYAIFFACVLQYPTEDMEIIYKFGKTMSMQFNADNDGNYTKNFLKKRE